MTFDFTMARSQQVASAPIETQHLLENGPVTQAIEPDLATVDQPTALGGWEMVILGAIAVAIGFLLSAILSKDPEERGRPV